MGEKAKEKAEELIDRYGLLQDCNNISVGRNYAKQCALIAVDEVILACEYNYVENWNTDWWNRVKDEINKL